MGTRLKRLVRGGAGAALLAAGMGAVGLGVGVASGGVAAASGPTVSGNYACKTPIGVETVPTSIMDLHTAPATLHEHKTYTLKPQLKFTVPATLIGVAHTATPTLKTLKATQAKLTLALRGFTTGTTAAPVLRSVTATNTPVVVPINTTTLHNGATATFTYPTVTVKMTATKTATATVKPGKLTMKVLVAFPCGAPGQRYTTTAESSLAQPRSDRSSRSNRPVWPLRP